MKAFLFAFLFSYTNSVCAQNLNIPFKLGLICEYGTHIQRIGIQTSTYATLSQHELAFEYQIYYNFKNLGPKNPYWESTFKTGYKFGFGPEDLSYIAGPFFNPTFDHLSEKYSVAYTLSFYLNKNGTQQSTGTIGFHVDDWNINIENDLWGNTTGKDRFRTGGFSVSFVNENLLFSFTNLLWTGDTKCKELIKNTAESRYPSRYGYKDLSKCLYGNYSHGILALGFAFAPENSFRQHVGASIGVDAEKIRNLIQNKIIHDMYFLPEALVRSKNLHVPMLDENGKPYLFQESQQLKPPSLFFQASANGSLSY